MGLLKQSLRATTGRRAVASWRSPTFSPSSNAEKYTIPCGSRPTCTTLPLTTSIRTRLHFRTSILSGNSLAGPIHAGTFGPNQLDKTFGPQLVYVKAPGKEQGQNLPPSEGLQFFGHVAIDGDTQQMTVTLKDVDDHSLWTKILDPALG